MIAARHLLRSRWAALLLAATLALRLLVPTGYMVGGGSSAPTLTICPGMAPMPAHRHAPADGHDHGGGPCAFAGLSAALIGPADPVAAPAPPPATAPVMPSTLTAGIAPAARRLRPPLRGPPAFA